MYVQTMASHDHFAVNMAHGTNSVTPTSDRQLPMLGESTCADLYSKYHERNDGMNELLQKNTAGSCSQKQKTT